MKRTRRGGPTVKKISFSSPAVLFLIYRLHTGLVEDLRAVPDLFSQSSSRSTYLILHNGEAILNQVYDSSCDRTRYSASWVTVPGY